MQIISYFITNYAKPDTLLVPKSYSEQKGIKLERSGQNTVTGEDHDSH